MLNKLINMQNYSDEQLIARYLKGDEESLEFLIKKYLQPIYSFVARYVGGQGDAKDITQEIFLKVWKNLKKFDSQRSFKTWIFSIAKNASIDFLRKKKALPFSAWKNEKGDNALTETLADPSPLPDELVARADAGEKLRLTMELLVPNYRTVLYLRYNDHFTFREIAETLEEPLHTIKSRHRRALIMLKKLLTESPL